MANQYQAHKAAFSEIAIKAGAAILEFYGTDAGVVEKGDGSPVTAADKAAEKIILDGLKTTIPEITIISEENAESHSLKAPDVFCLVDPLDGTKEFLRQDGKGSFTVNIAIIEHGIPIYGVVFAPALGRLFIGGAGCGALEASVDKNGAITGEKQISVRALDPKNLVAVASKSHRDEATNNWMEKNGVTKTVSIGSSLKFCLLAAAEADFYPRFGPTMEWDTGAGHAVLIGAGGFVKTPENQQFMYGKDDYRNGGFIAVTSENFDV